MLRVCFIILFLFCSGTIVFSQSPRKLNRQGVRNYNQGEYEKAEKNYKRALQEQNELTEASYNLALTYYRQKKYTQAINQFKITADKTIDKELLSKLYHSLGNSYLQENKLKESIDSYQNSLRLNPTDEETRHNLTYALMKFKARQNKEQKKTEDLLDKIEQEEKTSQQFMRRNKNLGKEVKNW